MPSPFPGMDPYLEQFWPDVHARLIVFSAGQIQRQLRGAGLLARVEERLIVEAPPESVRAIRGDVVISDRDPRTVDFEGGVAVAEPLVLSAEPVPQRSISIVDSKGGDIVTVIEFISPSNKLPGDGREQYLRKQSECLHGNINLVEIDLIRGGEHVIAYPFDRLPPTYQTTYILCAYRARGDKRFEIYRLPLDLRLPIIRIPLRSSDKDITLDLQAVLNQVYEEGAYDGIDYSRPCAPPLLGREAELSAKFLKSA